MTETINLDRALLAIAMHTGDALDLATMLDRSLRRMLDELPCRAIIVYRDELDDGGYVPREVFSILSEHRWNRTAALAVSNLTVGSERGKGRTNWNAPASYALRDARLSILDLPGYGVMVLILDDDHDRAITQALDPLCRKLAQACLHCEKVAALRASQDRLHIALNSVSDAVIATDRHGTVTQLNPLAERLCGWLAADAEGRSISEVLRLIDAKNHQPLENPVFRVLESGKPVGLSESTVLVSKSGEEFQVANSATPIKDEAGRINGVVIVVRDMTEEYQIRESLHQTQSLQRSLLDNMPSAVSIKDLNGNYLFVNRTYERMGNVSNKDIVGTTGTERFSAAYVESAHENDQQVLLTGKTLDFEESMDYDGELRSYLSTKFPLRRSDGEIYGVCGIATEITERKRIEDEVRNSSENFRLAFNQQFQFMALLSPDGRILEINDLALSAMNMRREEAENMLFWELPAWKGLEDWPERIRANIERIRKTGETYLTEDLFRAADGSVRNADAAYTAVFDETGSLRTIIVQAVDVTERRKQEEIILHHAHYDILTGLPNRFLTLDRLMHLIHEAERTGKHVGVLFADFDDFKKINDTQGHEVGDRLLVKAAQRMSEAVRDTDTVGRLGGDEFIVLLENLGSATDARPTAESSLEHCRRAFSLDDRELILTVSIGIAVFPEDGKTPTELLRNADTAMYRAKSEGRNIYRFYTSELNSAITRRLKIEEQMHGALKRDEFHVVYHPILRTRDRTIVGAEALLRWHNRMLGVVPPEEFIPIAEQTGLIVPIGLFVLNQALQHVAVWQRSISTGFRISVNMSPSQFRAADLDTQITSAAGNAGVDLSTVEIEITEGVLMRSQNAVSQILKRLSDQGVHFSMDDFGTGYSSLSYLRNFLFSVLKVDRSFIRDVMSDNSDRELVIAAIAMAHGLELSVIAEGVETEEQFDFLMACGCDFVQGFLFSEPLQADAFVDLLARKQAG